MKRFPSMYKREHEDFSCIASPHEGPKCCKQACLFQLVNTPVFHKGSCWYQVWSMYFIYTKVKREAKSDSKYLQSEVSYMWKTRKDIHYRFFTGVVLLQWQIILCFFFLLIAMFSARKVSKNKFLLSLASLQLGTVVPSSVCTVVYLINKTKKENRTSFQLQTSMQTQIRLFWSASYSWMFKRTDAGDAFQRS